MAPLLNCGRGCRKIYGGRYFRAGCATACDTPRRAKRRISRASDRTRKIAKRLHDKWGDATADVYDFPPKPPRMRCATYKRLEAQYDDLKIVGAWASLPGTDGKWGWCPKNAVDGCISLRTLRPACARPRARGCPRKDHAPALNVASQGRGPAKRRPAGCVLRGHAARLARIG